jgi:hypothetical protein
VLHFENDDYQLQTPVLQNAFSFTEFIRCWPFFGPYWPRLGSFWGRLGLLAGSFARIGAGAGQSRGGAGSLLVISWGQSPD